MCVCLINKIPLFHPALPSPGGAVLRSYQVPASVPCFITTFHRSPWFSGCSFWSSSLWTRASALVCSLRFWLAPLSSPALALSPLHFPPPLAPCCYHGSAVFCVQVVQKYNRTFHKGQDLNSSGSQSSPIGPLNLKQSIQWVMVEAVTGFQLGKVYGL